MYFISQYRLGQVKQLKVDFSKTILINILLIKN